MMDPIALAQLRYQIRLDGVAQDVARRLAADVQRAIDTVTADIARRVPEDAQWSFDHLQAVRKELGALRAALEELIAGTMTAARQGVVETAPAAVGEAATRVGLSFTAVPVDTLLTATAAPYMGRSWADYGKRLADKTLAAVESELREAAILGESVGKAAKRLEAVTGLQRANATRLARTALADWSNRSLTEVYRKNQSLIEYLEPSVVMDGRTSPVCQSISGKRFKIDDPDLPRPPLHPNCRTVLLPITRSFESIIGERGREMDERLAASREKPSVMSTKPVSQIPKDVRPQTIRRVPASLSYSDWLRDYCTPEFQKEVLGPTRYAAWKKGVPLSGMATYSRPLTIEELKSLYPVEFGNA